MAMEMHLLVKVFHDLSLRRQQKFFYILPADDENGNSFFIFSKAILLTNITKGVYR